jgi:hypothetical protein
MKYNMQTLPNTILKVYLAGFIEPSVIDQCKSWRKEIRGHYENWKGIGSYGIAFIDPTVGEVFDNSSDFVLPSTAIVSKDLLSIQRSDLLLANLDNFGCKREPYGTIMEIAMAWQLQKPIITITNNPVYISHPFIKTMSSIIVSTTKELLDNKILNIYFKSINGANY